MKKLLGIVATMVAITITIGFYMNYSTERDGKSSNSVGEASTQKIFLIEAKTVEYGSLEDLQERLPFAVKGVKINEKNTELQYSNLDDSLIGGHTVSNFKITEVLQKTEEDSSISVGHTIPVMEYSFFDRDSDTLYSYNGYTNMGENSEYILFLLPKEEDIYPIGSVEFGKVPINTNEVEIFNQELEAEEEVFGDTVKTVEEINKVYGEVKEEYLQ